MQRTVEEHIARCKKHREQFPRIAKTGTVGHALLAAFERKAEGESNGKH